MNTCASRLPADIGQRPPPSPQAALPGWRRWLSSLLLIAGTVAALAQGTHPAFTPYLDGLDALNEGRWTEAVRGFSRAVESKPDDATFLLARGVSQVLAEQFEPALKDLERAQRLGLRGREAQLWIYAAEAMSGIVINPDHALGGGRNRGNQPVVVSIPAHVAQGGNDYPTDYGSFIVYRVGMAYQNFRLPAGMGGTGDSAGVRSAPMREALRKAGQLFAERWLKRPELASANLARARQNFSGQDFGATLRDVERALTARPGDPELRLKAGEAWLALGRPATARREFTIALTGRTDLAAGYLGRARATAQLGDGRRAQADLDIAAKLDPAATKAARTAIEADLAKHKAGANLDAATTAFDRAVTAGTAMDRLIELARQVHLAAAPRRLRYDEYYQDRLRVLEDGTRAAPKNPDAWVRLSAFLLGEADNRGEVVEPRRELQRYRFHEPPDQERRRALAAAERALAANPRHVASLAQKALTLTALKRYDEAEKFAEQALAIGGNQPDALRLYGRFRAMRANQLSGEAFGLRQERTSSSTRNENRSDGVYEVTTTTTYPPTSAELNRAAQFEAQAVQLRRQARAAMEAAIKVTRGTAEGALIEADLHQWDGKLDAAQTALERALKLDPKSIEAHDQLGQFLVRNGRADPADEHQAVASQLYHTTSAPLLRLAWRRIDRKAWDAARGYLNRARALDPLDARALAMLGVCHEAESKPDLAAAAYRAALALEEARLLLDEPSVAASKPLGRDALDFGLAIQAAFHLARWHERQSLSAEALAQYRNVLGFAGRMKAGFESRQMFTALWPDQKPAKGAIVIQPDNAATLVAEAHLRAGKLLAATGRKQEAIAHYRSAAALGPLRMAGMPRIGNARGDSNFSGLAGAPAAEALFHLARELLAAGDAKGALQLLQNTGTHLPDHLQAELNQLHHEIANRLSR